MKIKRLTAIILAGVLTCTAPVMVCAENTSDMVDQAVELLEESGVDDFLSDPDNVVDIIVSVKETLGQADVSDEEIRNAIDMAADSLGVTVSDSEKTTLVKLYSKFKDMDLDEDALRTQVRKVYDKLESLGITKEDVKGILGKLIDLVKSILD